MSQRAERRSTLRTWLLWTAGFVSFPIAGLAGTAAAGRVDDALAAFLGGTVTGLVVGAGQVVASRHRLDWRRWVPATGLGMGVGLALGAAGVDYRTGLADLAIMGAVTGVALGIGQALALPARARRRWAWAVAMPALWALGWTVTTLIGYEVDKQVMVFGASGAVVFAALSGLLLHLLLPSRARMVGEVSAGHVGATA